MNFLKNHDSWILIFTSCLAAYHHGVCDLSAKEQAESRELEALVLEGLVAPGHKPEQIAVGFAFTEGPTTLPDGGILFTDQPNNRIYSWKKEQGIHIFLEPAQRANGLFATYDGSVLVCAEESRTLIIISPGGGIETVSSGYGGKTFNGPNDVWMHRKGFIFLTDPFYPRSWHLSGSPPQSVRGVYRIDPDGSTHLVISDLVQPNGIVGSSSENILYVSDISQNKTIRYHIAENGTLGRAKIVCEIGSDGMTLDERGNLYLTGKAGVTVVGADGEILGVISIPEAWTANVCFGGENGKTLYITASKSVYALQMLVAGLGEPPPCGEP